MNPERLLQNFDRLIDTPDAVPRLRRFILDLAVRGKLVEQNPEDEPAAELLKRIRAKKQGRAVRSLSAENGPLALADVDTPFEIPQIWEWVYATEPAILISDNGKKVQTKDVLESGRFSVVDQGKMFIRGYCNDEQKVIHVESPVIIFGDHTRETKLVDFDFVVGADGVKILQPIIIDPNYYFLALQWLPLNSRGYGRHFKLLRASLFPLPPLAEQHRIVAKVNELMKLCDELEATQAKREKRRDRLVAATLHGLNNGEANNVSFPLVGNPSEERLRTSRSDVSFKDSARFYFNHLPRLTTRLEHIQQLRQTILNLAVRGKVVPQDPKDEPASELLKQIDTEKNWLVKQGEIKKQEPLPPIQANDIPFEVPLQWKWIRLCGVGVLSGGMTPSKNRSDYWGGDINWFSPKDIKSYELIESELKITGVGLKETGLQLYPPGCLFMVARSGILKRTFPVSINRIEATANQDLKILRPFISGLERYIQIMLWGMSYFILSNLVKTGTTVQSLKYEEFERQPIPIPPLGRYGLETIARSA